MWLAQSLFARCLFLYLARFTRAFWHRTQQLIVQTKNICMICTAWRYIPFSDYFALRGKNGAPEGIFLAISKHSDLNAWASKLGGSFEMGCGSDKCCNLVRYYNLPSWETVVSTTAQLKWRLAPALLFSIPCHGSIAFFREDCKLMSCYYDRKIILSLPLCLVTHAGTLTLLGPWDKFPGSILPTSQSIN